MAVIRKKPSGKFELDYYVGAKRNRVSFNSRREAEEAKRALVFGIQGSVGLEDLQPKTLKEAIRFYDETQSVAKASRVNEKAYFTRLYRALRTEGVMMVHEVTPLHMEKFKTDRAAFMVRTKTDIELGRPGKQIAASTVNREFNTYRNFFEKCIDWKAIARNPCERVKNLKAKKNPRRPWTDEEFKLVVADVAAWAADVLWGMFWLGAGPSELSRVKWADVDFESGHVWIKRYKGTGEEIRRRMPIPPPFLAELKAKHQLARRSFKAKQSDLVFVNSKRNPIDARALGSIVRDAVERLGLSPDIVPYGLRHKFGTELLEANVGEEKVRRLMGHRSVKTLIDNYAHVKDEALRDAMNVRADQAAKVTRIVEKKGGFNGR